MVSTWPKAKQIADRKRCRIQTYEVIDEYKDENISWICSLLKVSRASYYKWKNRKTTVLELENEEVLKEIVSIADSNNSLFGARQMTYAVNELRASEDLKAVNHKRISRLMCINGIRSHKARYNKYHYVHTDPEQTAENILNKNFNTSGPDEKWGTDITEKKIPGTADKAYISTIVDLYGTFPVAVVVSRRNDVKLVNDTYALAVSNNPEAQPLFHSDRGFQYTRKPFAQMLKDHGMIQSMSRVHHCIDNGPVESFQGMIKEMVDVLYPEIHTYEEMEAAIYATYSYYINHVHLTRYKGKTPAQVRSEAKEAVTPIIYEIPRNNRIAKYWATIEEKQRASHNK